MGRIFQLSFCLIFYLSPGVRSEDILFPGNERLPTIDESEVDNLEEYVDPMKTGSYLYDSQATTSTGNKLLGYNIPVRAFASEQSRYFRAHPTFMKCAQQTIMKLRRDGVTVEILIGYKSASEIPDDSTISNYLRSGCAMQLGIREGGNGTIEGVAAAVFQTCPVIVEREHRDLGLILMSDRVHFHMSGADSVSPLYQLDPGYTGDVTDIESWAQEEINRGLEPDANPSCDLFSPLSADDHYPANKDQFAMFGQVDVRITRNMTVDFSRLVQYQGSSIVFENNEGYSTWCGEEGRPCPQCSSNIQGNSLNNRCADRVMTQRLLSLLNKLQRKVRLAMNDKLKVTEAWVEPHSANPEGDADPDQLHYEGRAAKIQLVNDNSETTIGVLSKYAICLGADYIEHRGTYLYVAVKRAQLDPVKVTFPSIELLSVDPPSPVDSLYSLPKEFPESIAVQYPLFDSKGRLDKPIASGVTLGQFVSPTYPYFRINPKIVECYSDIVYHENKRRKDGDPEIELEIIRGYLTNVQNQRKFDVIKDQRANRHNLGMAMQLRYNPGASLSATHTPYRLMYTVVHKCAPRFASINQQMGIGLYSDSVYVDIRQTFHLMEESLEHLPEGVDIKSFENDIYDRYLLAKDRRIVDPDNHEIACLFARKPEPQHCDFQHEHSEGVKRRRRRRETNPNDCVPNRYTDFCSSTVEHRNAVVKEIKSMLDRKHYACRTEKEIKEALIGCFGECGTCMTGEIFESKQEHCNNLLHWIDWKLMNREPHTTNFFLRSNDNARVHACENGADCIENAPLFSLIAPSVEKIYRPDPKQSVEEELYSSVNNPMPAYQLLEDIYAIQASGVVKFWIKDDSEMTALKRPLEVVMLYNINVTLIEIYVERYEISQQAVTRIVENAALEMTINGCPDVTRETLTPYKVLAVPPEYRKRAAEPPSLRRQIREYHKNYEARWAERNILL